MNGDEKIHLSNESYQVTQEDVFPLGLANIIDYNLHINHVIERW